MLLSDVVNANAVVYISRTGITLCFEVREVRTLADNLVIKSQ
jgi:hypothetical protein